MKKLDLNIQITDESGKPLANGVTLAKSLGSTMLQSGETKEVDILKLYMWALQLGKDGIIEIDKLDLIILKTFVIENKSMYIIVKAPILKAIEELKF